MFNIIITIDRIEGKYAVCMDKNEYVFNLPLNFFKTMPKDNEKYDIVLTKLPEFKEAEERKIKNLFNQLKK